MLNLSVFRKPKDIGLAIRRAVTFFAPVLLIVGAIGFNVVAGMLRDKPEEKEDEIRATAVVVAVAEKRPVNLELSAQGETAPLREINLTAQVNGRVAWVSENLIEGGAFLEGDILAKIEPDEYEFRIIQARAQVAGAQSRYVSEEAESNIAAKDWAELGNGDRNALALREPQLAEAAANLASARAALREAELQLERTIIRAPFNGRVRTKMIDIGEYVAPGAQLGQIFSTDVMSVALPLTDTQLGQLGLNVGFRETDDSQGPVVRLNAFVGGTAREWRGRIARTSSAYDRETRVIFAYAEIDDPYGADGAPLAAGLFVDAVIEGRAIQDSVVVPRTALRAEREVFIADANNQLEIRPVQVASSNRTEATLLGGVIEGERVIVSPIRGATAGLSLEVVDKNLADAATPTLANAAQ